MDLKVGDFVNTFHGLAIVIEAPYAGKDGDFRLGLKHIEGPYKYSSMKWFMTTVNSKAELTAFDKLIYEVANG